jgi:hypothetical protein
MQEENKIAPAASSHTEIQIRPKSLSASSRQIRTKELGQCNLDVSRVAVDLGRVLDLPVVGRPREPVLQRQKNGDQCYNDFRNVFVKD